MALIEEAASDPPKPPGGNIIAYRLKQQRILAEFGMEALRSRDVDAMLQRATELCANGMGTTYCKFLDAPDSDHRMLVHAGVGWGKGVVGDTTLGADTASAAGFAYQSGEAVISNHLEDEERFRTPEMMADHGIKRAINVLVEASGRRYGVLEVDSPNEGKFDEDDLAFMQGFANLIGVAIERQHAEEKLNEAVARQELLIREASHRVKNSLALVSAMLELQMREDDDPRVARLLGDAQARVSAIAQAHNQLWRGDQVGVVQLDDLICGVVDALGEQAPRHTLSCHAEPISISADTAIPLGLIVTELVTNAIKYAYGEEGGAITVEVHGDGMHIVASVTDTGTGLPIEFEIAAQSKKSLGMRMIVSLARQLRGTIGFAVGNGGGTVATLRFPDPRIEQADG